MALLVTAVALVPGRVKFAATLHRMPEYAAIVDRLTNHGDAVVNRSKASKHRFHCRQRAIRSSSIGFWAVRSIPRPSGLGSLRPAVASGTRRADGS